MRTPLMNFALLGLAALSACAASRPAQRAERPPEQVGAGRGLAPLATNAGQVEGVVAEVDREEGIVSVRSGDVVREVRLADDAAVLVDDFDASFEDVQEGQAVRAALQETDGRVEAVRIQILNQALPVEAAPEPAANAEAPPEAGAEGQGAIP